MNNLVTGRKFRRNSNLYGGGVCWVGRVVNDERSKKDRKEEEGLGKLREKGVVISTSLIPALFLSLIF